MNRDTQATNPRDQIYAILGLIQKRGPGGELLSYEPSKDDLPFSSLLFPELLRCSAAPMSEFSRDIENQPILLVPPNYARREK